MKKNLCILDAQCCCVTREDLLKVHFQTPLSTITHFRVRNVLLPDLGRGRVVAHAGPLPLSYNNTESIHENISLNALPYNI